MNSGFPLVDPAVLTMLKLVWLHFFADFVLQTDGMAQGKSRSDAWLLFHVLVYSFPFGWAFGWRYAAINGLLHFIVDWFTSRINKRLWDAKKVHWFFVGVGFDQAVHYTALFLTAMFMGLLG
jgi:hypothetical protein